MNSYQEVVVLVEGTTEKNFINRILAPYLHQKYVSLTPIVLSKPGQKGGDVKFARAQKDIGLHLKQRSQTKLTLMVDYYAIDPQWPGLSGSKGIHNHHQKAACLNQATMASVVQLFGQQRAAERFIPYVSMYEFEALLFSDTASLCSQFGVDQKEVDTILRVCGEPEKINDGPETAPSKRLSQLIKGYKKTTQGIDLARTIGIPAMRHACPLFDGWVCWLESLGPI